MKIEYEELLEVISLWPLSPATHSRIREIIEGEPSTEGAWLFRYYGKRPSKVAALESCFVQEIRAAHAIAVNSGTSALIAALAAIGISPGDDVLIPAYTFVATAAAVLVAGGIPNLVEIDESLSMDAVDLEKKITSRSKAVIVVHMVGRPANMEAIVRIARRRGLVIVEDVAQACGGTFKGKCLGTFGDAGCFSFGQYKLVSAGEGGMVVTSNEHLAMRVRGYHDTAACWRPDRYAPARVPGELFPGENYRMSELHAAVALVQLQKLRRYLTGCREYRNALCGAIGGDIAPCWVVPSHDESGDTGEWLVLRAPDVAVARALVGSLSSKQIFARQTYSMARDWHVYAHWEHILNQSTANRVAYPYSTYPMRSIRYSSDACPKTLDILGKTVMLNIPNLMSVGRADSIAKTLASAMRMATATR